MARSICRRAERQMAMLVAQEAVQQNSLHFVNRLSDFFFVAARFAAYHANEPEVTFKASEYGPGEGFPLPPMMGQPKATDAAEVPAAAASQQPSSMATMIVPALCGALAAVVTIRVCKAVGI